ncbi:MULTISPECIES: ABC transporter ATP-binding protein [Gordonia]|uniref:Putative ABC transporter permease/ATP-binding protein n=1 Tax=Gordonia sihwensis NBRC 108236 TaxID=1223544 RepID=L7LJE9_9ACTN|nr:MULTISPECIES: ABC transporter ATP-binding protein [Gordonia]GAC60974.1 putative ABC transporter permease/ATP-binding protein [Gordonia sihwensis NBRC 108236]
MSGAHAARPGADLVRLAASSMRNRRAIVAGVILAQILAMAASLAQPTFNALIIDNGVVAGDVPYIERMGAIMLAVAIGGLVASLAAIALGAALSAGTSADLRRSVYRHVADFSTATYHELGTPTLLTRTSLDTSVVGQAVFLTTSVAVAAPLVTVGAIAMSLRESVRLAPVIVVTAIVLSIGIGIFVVYVTPLATRVQGAVDRVNRVLREQLGGTRIIRAFRRERAASTRFSEVNRDLTALVRRVAALQLMLLPGVLLIANLASVATSLFGARLIEDSHLTIGGLTAFTGYLMQIVAGITVFIALAGMLPRARASATRLSAVINRPAGLDDDGTAVVEGPLPLTFRSATVRYEGADHPAVDAVSLKCLPGTVTAVIGGTSSGKSSLLALVPRLLDPASGTVEAGGVRLGAWHLPDLRAAVAHVGQGQSLVAGTVESNLRLGDAEADDDRLWRALEAAQMATTVVDRGGLSTEVAQGGSNFSGGQRQRLAVARALVRRPRILCLDSAFSAMDRSTAESVLSGIRATLPEATILLADQQVDNVRSADLIGVLDAGRIVATGRHEDLLTRCAVYREFAQAQAAPAPAPAPGGPTVATGVSR